MEQLIGPDIAGMPNWNLRDKTPHNEATTVPWHQGIVNQKWWFWVQKVSKTYGCLIIDVCFVSFYAKTRLTKSNLIFSDSLQNLQNHPPPSKKPYRGLGWAGPCSAFACTFTRYLHKFKNIMYNMNCQRIKLLNILKF